MTEVFTFNRHTPYIHLLSYADVKLNVYGKWDENMRPRRSNINTIEDSSRIKEKLRESDVWLSHLIYPDLIYFIRQSHLLRQNKKIVQILHGKKSRTGHIRSGIFETVYSTFKQNIDIILNKAASLYNIHFVFISEEVSRSWKLDGTIIYPGAINLKEMATIPNPTTRDDYALVVGNRLNRDHFKTDILQKISEVHDIIICGTDNDDAPFETVYIPWEDLQHHYRSCLCYLNLLSPPENPFNLATIEAMSAGAPILTFSHPDNIFTDGEDALVCSNAQEFVDTIIELERDDDFLSTMSTNSRKFAKDNFSMEIFINKWNSVLKYG